MSFFQELSETNTPSREASLTGEVFETVLMGALVITSGTIVDTSSIGKDGREVVSK